MNSIPLTMIDQPVDLGVPLPAHEEDPYELVGMVIPARQDRQRRWPRRLSKNSSCLAGTKSS